MITVFYNHITEAMRQEGMSLEEVAGIIREHGIEGVEIDYRDLNPTGMHFNKELASELKAVGLPIYGVYVFYDWGKHPLDQSYKRIYRELRSIDVHNSLAIPGMIPPGANRRKYTERMKKTLARAVKYANENGVRVLMEDFDDCVAPFSTSEGMLEFFNAIPELKCAFDTGNFYYSDEDVLKVFPLFKDRIEYVHLKDRSLTIEPQEEPKKTISGVSMYSAAVGQGIIPIRRILKELKDIGYEGSYAVEHFGSIHQLRDMIESADFVRKVLEELN